MGLVLELRRGTVPVQRFEADGGAIEAWLLAGGEWPMMRSATKRWPWRSGLPVIELL